MKGLLCLITIVIVLSAGCASQQVLRNPGSPEQSFDDEKDIQALEQQYGQASAITNYYKGPKTMEARNEFIAGRLTLINLQYIKFIRNLSATKAQMESAFDILISGVGLATTLSGGQATKAALGAVSTGVGATRTSIDKNFFYEQTLPALITAMNAQRKVALVPIVEGMKLDVDKYPFEQGITDLSTYYFAGTLVGALQGVEKDSAATGADAQTKIDKAIEIARTPGAAKALATKINRDRMANLLTRIDQLSNKQALALAKNPPSANQLIDDWETKSSKKPWLSDPASARGELKIRVMEPIDPDSDLTKWEQALQ